MKYQIEVIYDTTNEIGLSETVSVEASSLEAAVERINDYDDPVANHLPKVYESHQEVTKQMNPSLSPTDLIFLERCKYAF